MYLSLKGVRPFKYVEFFILVLLIALIAFKPKEPTLKNGLWRAVITRPDGKEIVFQFLSKDSAGKKILYVLNAEERLLVDSINYAGDSVFIQMPFFDSEFRAKMTANGNLVGNWLKRAGDRLQVLPFKATYNKRERFPTAAKPRYNATGRWDITFTNSANRVLKSVGEFRQKGSRLTGTFLTSTGDYRYLEGVVSGDSLVLSAFDGAHAYLFTAKLVNNNTISAGNFYSAATGLESWEGRRDATASLPDGYQQTALRQAENKLNFRFRSTDGDTISINDERFKNKVVVVQILGSWCPNCMDETKFLSEYYNANKGKGIEFVGLAYERTTDFDRSKQSLQTFQKRFNVQYPILVTGVTVADEHRTEKTLPQLQQIKAFPTSIFIDKKGIVRKIYSGFSGPGTGEHYTAFKKEFEETISALLKE